MASHTAKHCKLMCAYSEKQKTDISNPCFAARAIWTSGSSSFQSPKPSEPQSCGKENLGTTTPLSPTWPYTTPYAGRAACTCRSDLLEERGHGILLPPEKLAKGSCAPLSAVDRRSVTLTMQNYIHIPTIYLLNIA